MPPHPARAYLKRSRSRLAKAQVGHYMASDLYRRAHHWIGIPLVVASAAVSCTLTVSPEAPGGP